MSARTVSVIVPCRNERAHLAAFLDSVRAQVLPAGWALQVVIADGMSDDGSAALLHEAARRDPRLVVVDNPLRIVSTGLNRALAVATGEVIVRFDVHTEYAPDYVAACIAALERTQADNVGGAWHARPARDAGAMARAIAAAFQSRWVTGGALSRRLDHDGPADTVYLGAWPRATFDRYGGFDEALVRNQDDEHNLRITRGGGRVWQASAIRSTYRPRARLGQVFRQYRQYGYWKPFVMKKHGQPARLRQLAPLALVLATALAAIAWPLGAGPWPLAAVLGSYAAGVLASSVAVAVDGRLDVASALCVPAVVVAYHVAYGIGSAEGWRDVLLRRGPDLKQARLTR